MTNFVTPSTSFNVLWLDPINNVRRPTVYEDLTDDNATELVETDSQTAEEVVAGNDETRNMFQSHEFDQEQQAYFHRLKHVLLKRFGASVNLDEVEMMQKSGRNLMALREVKQMSYADLFEAAKKNKRIDRKEFVLARGLYVIDLYDRAKLPIANVADEAGCSQSTVRQIMKCRQDYEVDGPLYHQCLEAGSKTNYLLHLIKHELKFKPEVSRSTKAISRAIGQHTSMRVTPYLVRRLLKNKLGMRYRKLQPQQQYINYPANVEARYEFAAEIIKDLEAGKIILSADECGFKERGKNLHGWTSKDDYAHMHARHEKFKNVTMVACVSSDGRQWYHFIRGPHDSIGFTLFLERLAEDLETRDAGWRARYVLYVDSARIHQAAMASDRVQRLHWPIKLAGKAAFAAIPVENYFWLLRKHYERDDDINQNLTFRLFGFRRARMNKSEKIIQKVHHAARKINSQEIMGFYIRRLPYISKFIARHPYGRPSFY